MLKWFHIEKVFTDVSQWGAIGKNFSYVINFCPDESRLGYVWSYRKKGRKKVIVSPRFYEKFEQAKDAAQEVENLHNQQKDVKR